MSIFVCGDIHSTLDIHKLNVFIDRDDLNEQDYLIICGDTGICGFSKGQETATREYLRKLPMTILFADGNHEQFDALNSYSVDEWNGGKVHIIEPGIIHLMRGQVYQIDGKRFFVFGGAYSIDRAYRNLGFTWFEEEIPSQEEYEEAWKNLEACDYEVDYIISHTGPYEVITELGYECHDEALEQVRSFQQVADCVDFKDWYFGHFHEYALMQVLDFVTKEITEDSISKIDEKTLQNIIEYQNIGGQVTLDEFHKLSKEEQQDIIEYLEEFTAYEEINVNGKEFIIIHAGFINFKPERKMEDYQLYELIFKAPNYERVYFEDKYLVTGHLPTRAIYGAKPDEIYIANNHIAIDCASGYGGKVGCIRLDDFKRFYSVENGDEK